jgi:CubicO group peptidase (beta-lactamase class C family)
MSNIGERIDSVLAAHVKQGEPGAAVGVLKGGTFIHRKAYGLADLEWNIPLVPESVFRLASVTKQFTAVAIMMLAERGLLSLDASVNDYLDFPLQGRRVTVRQLLNHTSGIKSYSSLPNFIRDTSRLRLSLDQLVALIRDQPFDFEPGERYLYNNSGYVLAGAIIERLSDCKYRDFLKREIFGPLDMTRTCYLFDELIVGKRAYGYQRTARGLEHATPISMTWPSAAGGLGSTLDDLALWDRAIRSNRLIGKESFAAMLEPTKLSDGSIYPYGLGWGVGDYLGRALYHHTGGLSGVATHMTHFRDTDVTLIVLANRSLFPVPQITRALARCVFEVADPEPAAFKPQPSPLASYAGAYTVHDAPPGFRRKLVESADGLEFPEPDPVHLVAIGDHLFQEAGDAEALYRFGDFSDGRHHRFTVEAPMWPPQVYVRTPD